MSCSTPNCNCKKTPCGCEQGIPSAPFCGAPTCPNPEPCAETWRDCCVIHNGDSFAYVVPEAITPGPQFTILQGERMCDTWQRFIAYYFCGEDNTTVYGLKSTNITSTSLTVAWTPLPSINQLQYYNVYYCPVSASPLTFVSAGTVPYNNTTPSLTITGLTPNTSYYVNVVVTDGVDKACSSVSLILTTLSV